MASLVYIAISSLDGFMGNDEDGFSWSVPSEEVFAFHTESMKTFGTHLYGRRMYETMAVWETMNLPGGPDRQEREFGSTWRSAQKIVYSTTLEAPSTPNTRIERSFDADTVAALKRESSRDISVGGPNLAVTALDLGLVDECRVFIHPIVLGRGNRVFPSGLSLRLELLDEKRFANGVVYVRYKTAA